LCFKLKFLELETQIVNILMSVVLRAQRPQQAQVNFPLIFLHIHGRKIKGISNMQKFCQKCGVVEAADTVLDLPVRLNPQDSGIVNGHHMLHN